MPPKHQEIDVNPLWILFPSLLVIGSVAFRRSCVRPGGSIHRWSKKQSETLLKSAGLLVVGLASLAILIVYLYLESLPMALGTSTVVLIANAFDQFLPKSQKGDILEFKTQLRKSLAPSSNNDGAESDSSESYDMERHGGDGERYLQ